MSRVRSATASSTPTSSRDGAGVSAFGRVIPVALQGQRLGNYRLCLELASGGMASVYLARVDGRTGMHRFVALKRVHPHLANDPAFVEMFLDESRIASLVQHPNVCSVFDFDSVDGEYYLAMEFLAGEPLSAVWRAMARRPPDEVRAPPRAALIARIIADACEGLHAAHELRDPSGNPMEVVHRDVSPENVFLTYDGVVKIVDFGVARAAEQRHLTVPGTIKGKLAYMAPEVLRGLKPDRRADIWSLGVVLWELLTGKRLFQRSTDIETLKTIAEVHVPPPSEQAADVPKELDAVVLRALDADRNRRYATARELGRDLMAVLARRGEAVGLAELSEWMDDLFPAGRACKRQLLEIAAVSSEESSPGGPVASASDPEGTDSMESRPTTVRPAPSSIREKSTQVRRAPRTRAAKQGDTSVSQPPPGDSPRVPHRRWIQWTAALGAAAALSVALVSFARLQGDARAEAEGDRAPIAITSDATRQIVRAAETPAPPPAAAAPAASPAPPISPGPYSVEIVAAPGGDPNSWMLYLKPLQPPPVGASPQEELRAVR